MSAWAKLLTLLGVAIALLNMGLAWSLMFQGPSVAIVDDAGRRRSDAASGSGVARDSTRSATPEVSGTVVMEMRRESLKNATFDAARQHHEAILILAFSFALLAIGFSLFVMGVEGALDIAAQGEASLRVAGRMTSPGLACLLAAALLIGFKLFLADFDTPGRARARAIEAEGLAKQEADPCGSGRQATGILGARSRGRGEAPAMEAEANIKEQEALLRRSRPNR